MPSGHFVHCLARSSDKLWSPKRVATMSLSFMMIWRFASTYSTLTPDFKSRINVVDSSRHMAAPTGAPAHATTYASARFAGTARLRIPDHSSCVPRRRARPPCSRAAPRQRSAAHSSAALVAAAPRKTARPGQRPRRPRRPAAWGSRSRGWSGSTTRGTARAPCPRAGAQPPT
jgi:hypothetical protein